MTKLEINALIAKQYKQIETLDKKLVAGEITATFHRIGIKMSKRTISSCKKIYDLADA